jgi:ubiquitin-protein ligase
MRLGGGDDDGRQPPADIQLSPEERDDLLIACADLFDDQRPTERILGRIGFPVGRRPSWTDTTAEDVWAEIFRDLDRGILECPYRRLIAAALRSYGANPVLLDLARRHGLAASNDEPSSPRPEAPAVAGNGPRIEDSAENGDAGPDSGYRVIIRANSEADRSEAGQLLTGCGLNPTESWSTGTAVSFQLGVPPSSDPSQIRRALDETGLGWTLVRPGQPDYLFHRLFVYGPDGRLFRITDAPAQQTFRNVAQEVVSEEYPAQGDEAQRPVVIDHNQSGQGHRVDPDATLHDAGVQEGDELRVAFQATAGAVNPVDRQEALFRVRKQLIAFAESHPGFTVEADSSLLPMRYRIQFSADSWAPPPQPGGEPVRTDQHVLEIRLGPEFPMTPPAVFWRSPIFHPNVAPMYDTPEHRVPDEQKGLVCLGLLAESWQPSLDFGDLCRTLVDMAGFRNYGLVDYRVLNGVLVAVPNVYDAVAKAWVEANPDLVVEIGGVSPAGTDVAVPSGPAPGSGYGLVIEPV